MPYCQSCGTELKEHQDVCLSCGTMVKKTTAVSSIDTGGFGWGLLGFCIPIVGLILFLVWRTEKPRTSSAAGKGALISVILGIVLYVIYIVFLVTILADYGFNYTYL